MIYFVADLTSFGRPQLGEVALEHAFPEGVELAIRQCASGPSGASGVVVASDASRAAYFPDDQVWREISPAFGRRRWCGWWKEQGPPTPASLARATLLDGPIKRLADGQEWQIPRAYKVDGGQLSSMLPRALARQPSGEWVYGDPLPRYRSLWELCERIYDRSLCGEDRGRPVRLHLDDLAGVLGANYRVGPDECGVLGVFDSTGHAAREVAAAVIDLEGLIELQKKSEPPDA